MNLFILTYQTIDGYAKSRLPFRDNHLAHATAAVARGELLAGGAVGDPIDSAVLVFQASGPEIVESFAQTDPYVLAGLVTNWTVKPWAVVIGTANLQHTDPNS